MKSFKEFIQEKDYKRGSLFSIVNKIEQKMPDELENVISSFVGHEKDKFKKIKKGEDVSLYGFMDVKVLFNYVKNNLEEIKELLRPAIDYIKETYGDKITLYRFQNIEDENEKREFLSWSLNLKFVKDYSLVYNVKKIKLPTTEDLEKYWEQLNKIGITKVLGTIYKVDKKQPEYFNIYQGKEFITDGNMNKEEFIDLIQDKIDYYENRQTKNRKGHIYKKEVPLDDIIWITNRANQQEFIVFNDGDYGDVVQ